MLDVVTANENRRIREARGLNAGRGDDAATRSDDRPRNLQPKKELDRSRDGVNPLRVHRFKALQDLQLFVSVSIRSNSVKAVDRPPPVDLRENFLGIEASVLAPARPSPIDRRDRVDERAVEVEESGRKNKFGDRLSVAMQARLQLDFG